MNIKKLKDIKTLSHLNINYNRIKKIFPLHRHFEIVKHSSINKLENGIYIVKNRKHGFNNHNNLPNVIINKLFKNEISSSLNRSPIFCRYNIFNAPNSILNKKSKYYYVIPIGDFRIFQSKKINDIGQYYILSNTYNDFIGQNINNLEKKWIKIINEAVNSYSENNHINNTHEVLLDCEEYLLISYELLNI